METYTPTSSWQAQAPGCTGLLPTESTFDATGPIATAAFAAGRDELAVGSVRRVTPNHNSMNTRTGPPPRGRHR